MTRPVNDKDRAACASKVHYLTTETALSWAHRYAQRYDHTPDSYQVYECRVCHKFCVARRAGERRTPKKMRYKRAGSAPKPWSANSGHSAMRKEPLIDPYEEEEMM